MPEQVVADARHGSPTCRATTSAGRSRSSGTACARSPTPSPAACAWRARNGNDITTRYPELHRLNRALSSHSAILDGEIVAFDDAGPPELRPAAAPDAHRVRGPGAAAGEGVPGRLRGLRPAVARRALAHGPAVRRSGASCSSALELKGPNWQVPDHVVGERRGAARGDPRRRGSRAIVAKRLDARTSPAAARRAGSRSRTSSATDVVVGGWMPGEGRRASASARCWSACDEDGRLRYAGRVGTGFTEPRARRGWRAARAARARRARRCDAPGRQPPRGAVLRRAAPRRRGRVHRVDADGRAAPPVLQGAARGGRARRSLPRRRAARARRHGGHVEGRALKRHQPRQGPVSGGRLHQARRASTTTCSIAPVLLPHLARPPADAASATPTASTARLFFEKHCPRTGPTGSQTAPVQMIAQDDRLHASCDDLADARLARQPRRPRAAHVAARRRRTIERPTMLVFDLDPGPPATIVECCRSRCGCAGMFEGLGLRDGREDVGLQGPAGLRAAQRPTT